MRYGFGSWFKSVLALALVCLLGVAGLAFKGSALSELNGARTYYLHSASSWASQKSAVGVLELPFVTGESVSIEAVEADEFVQSVLELYAAQVQFVEEVDGVTAYYCYSERLPMWIWLNGKVVNLHIALSTSGAAVIGTPIIFGGY